MNEIKFIPQIGHRDYFPELLNRVGLNRYYVEVGVDTGEFSQRFIVTANFNHLFLVDPWRHKEDNDYTSADFNFRYLKTVMRAAEDPRVVIVRMESLCFSYMVPDLFFDFVYIDALHDEKNAYDDINAWYPKIVNGGILAGHDYQDGCGVKCAVDRFTSENKLEFFVTKDIPYCSWYLQKIIK
jgi:hypothetical protein